MSPGYDHVRTNLAAVRARLEQAARAAGRDPASVRLIAVSKTFPLDAVRVAWDEGQRDFGENRVQEALQKIAGTSDIPVRWHLIGHLQSNKAKRAASAFHSIHSIDSLSLLERVDAAAAEANARPELLVQVDLAGEATKFGASPGDVETILRADLHAARLVGLMLLPPWSENSEEVRPYFRRLAALRDTLLARGVPPERLRELSMGMSHDFEAAIAEGATIVRVGTAIFGQRQPGAGTENG